MFVSGLAALGVLGRQGAARADTPVIAPGETERITATLTLPPDPFASTDWDGELGSITLQTQSVWLGFSVYFE